MRTGAALLTAVVIALTTGAAAASPPPTKPGVVFVIGGVGGWDPLPRSCELVFPLANVPHKICDFVWTHGWGRMFADLQDTPHLIARADELAGMILQFKEAEPDRPVYVVAKSGGVGLALLAADRLPPETLERMVLISAAVSPEFDLRPALRATRGAIVSFWSRMDVVILGLGTWKFGTVDRVRGPGAGRTGFRPPPDLDDEGRELYRRLVEIHWHPRMILQGYFGFHSGNSLPGFIAFEVAPWLR
jgi:hypothetical protein